MVKTDEVTHTVLETLLDYWNSKHVSNWYRWSDPLKSIMFHVPSLHCPNIFYFFYLLREISNEQGATDYKVIISGSSVDNHFHFFHKGEHTPAAHLLGRRRQVTEHMQNRYRKWLMSKVASQVSALSNWAQQLNLPYYMVSFQNCWSINSTQWQELL